MVNKTSKTRFVATEIIPRCHNPFKFLSQPEVREQFIYSVYTKDMSAKKGQARDTSVHVTLCSKLDKESTSRWLAEIDRGSSVIVKHSCV